jgi:transcriptional regulator with GAF, ATPase, and Fis domain
MLKLRVEGFALAESESDKAVLGELLQTVFSINVATHADAILDRLLERIFSLMPAERGAVLFAKRKPGTVECAAFRVAPPDVDEEIVEEAMSEYNAVVGDENGSSLLCTPLRVFNTVLGVIYLDSSKPAAFTRDHLQLMIAISSITASALQHLRYVERLESENQRLHEEIEQEHGDKLRIIGDSPRLHDVRRFISKVAPSDATALILGPSGTGKELVARSIHQNSKRAAGPFVAVNCGAITETLVESELFGYEKGAFTGANELRKGKIEVADGGTLFLDEVGELTMPMQAALLRVIQEREFHRVGGTRSISVDVRLVAATNRNLEERIRKGRFREDLYFRLKVVVLRMPPLAECRSDIPTLASHFLQKKRYIRVVSGFSPEAQRVLTSHDWPGNVRELEGAIHSAVLLGESQLIQLEDLPEYLTTSQPAEAAPAGNFYAQISALKKSLAERALADAQGSYTEAARRLGVSPSYFRRLALNFKIDLPLRATNSDSA